jgi:host factor-I protein
VIRRNLPVHAALRNPLGAFQGAAWTKRRRECGAAAKARWTEKDRPIPFGTKTIEKGHFMPAEKNQNVQDVFLNYIRKNKAPVTIFLVNGVKLQGIVTWFDNFSLLLRRDGHTQLVYKHAISTIMPASPVQLFDPSKEEAEA